MLQGKAKAFEQNNVAVQVAEVIVFGDLLSTVEYEVKPLGTVFVSFDMRFVADSKPRANFRGAFIVSEQNDLDIRMQQCPALQSIALDYGGMADEGLCGGEEG